MLAPPERTYPRWGWLVRDHRPDVEVPEYWTGREDVLAFLDEDLEVTITWWEPVEEAVVP